MKKNKKIFIWVIAFMISFTFVYAQPKQRAEAVLPAIVAGQVIKKATGKALLSLVQRKGGRQATVYTMEKTVKMLGSRMTPAQLQSFTGAIEKGTKSLDNKWVKVLIGAEAVQAVSMINDELQRQVDMWGGTDSGKVDYNEGYSDVTDDPALDTAVQEVLSLPLQTPIFYTAPYPQMDMFGFHVWSVPTGYSRHYHMYTTMPTQIKTSVITSTEYGNYYDRTIIGSDDGTYGARTDKIQEESKYGMTGMQFLNQGTTVRITVYYQTDNLNLPASNHEGTGSGDPSLHADWQGHLYVNFTMTAAQWETWSTTYGDMEVDYKKTHQFHMGDIYSDSEFASQYPYEPTGTGEYELQIPNPEYWENPANFPGQSPLIDPYKEFVKANPVEATVPNPDNYPITETEPVPITPPVQTPGSTPGTPYVPPPGEGCTEALRIPRFIPLLNTVSDSFPFSIPFDLYDGFQALFSEMGSNKPEFNYTFDFNGSTHTWNIKVPAFFDSWKTFTDSFLIFVFDVGILYAVFRFRSGGE